MAQINHTKARVALRSIQDLLNTNEVRFQQWLSSIVTLENELAGLPVKFSELKSIVEAWRTGNPTSEEQSIIDEYDRTVSEVISARAERVSSKSALGL